MELEEYYPNHTLREAIAKQVAIFKVAGLSMTAISKKMGINLQKASTIYDSIECEHFVKQIGNRLMSDFNRQLISEVSKLVPLMVETLQFHLEQKNLNAIPHALKIMGFDKETQEQASQIVVHLPGESKATTFEVKAEKVDNSIKKEIEDKLEVNLEI